MRHFFSVIGVVGLGVVGACQSSDLSFLEPADTQGQAETQAQNPITSQEQQGPVANGQPQSLTNPQANQNNTADAPPATAGNQVASADQNTANAQTTETAPANAEAAATASGQHGSGAVQGSLSQAAAGPPIDDGKTRVEVKPSGGGLVGNVRHEVNQLFGGTTNVRVNEVTNIQDEMVTGIWNLEEEDGLRTCTIGFSSSEDNNQVNVTPGCSETIATISEWGVFGEDLLLRDSLNSVVVRMRQSSNSWVGFTLASGIPIILTR